MAEPSTTRGVFLSYPREDTEAARRIADALRGFGVDVWFDQSELRGGDAWDAKIKRQIRDCALFVPIVSASSQSRGEGYFRREWKLAIERTHDMAAGIPFLLPVVIDQTLESKALVPEEFMRVQWTRLAGGIPTPQFVERVKRLLDTPLDPQEESRDSRPFREGSTASPIPRSGFPGWAWGVIAGLVIAAVAVIGMYHKPSPPAVEVKTEVAPAVQPKAVPNSSDKSIAVLPFENMSDEKGNEFFTDGIQEDILTNLALVHEIRVISRTSVMQYRDTKKPIGQIASELGVSYILEGSVRREGNKVRVTGQLIHASTDEHVWAKAYDRDLTDIFAIQSELAQAIATELKAALSPEEKAMLDRRPTENTEAYDLYLRSRGLAEISEKLEKQKLLEKAVALDPTFARAWGDLADEYAFSVFNYIEGMDEMSTKAKAAIDNAVRLAPDDPEVITSLGTYYYYAFRDYARANEQYQKLARQRPNDASVLQALGLIQRRQGRWADALSNIRRATELDVANLSYLGNLISCLTQARRYDELAVALRKKAELEPEKFLIGLDLAYVSFHATGSTREVEAFFSHLTPEQASSPEGIYARRNWADSMGDLKEVVRLDRLQPYSKQTGLENTEQDVLGAQMLYLAGDKSGAVARLGHIPEELRKRMEREPKNPRLLAFDAIVELVLGHPAEAIRSSDRSVELTPESLDAVYAPIYAALGARIHDHAGDKEKALSEYSRLLHSPGGPDFFNVYEMKRDSTSTLYGDPRFEAILNDPANNAPVF
jgi:TolB-like protein/Tfp pilus assembly protein PilF